MFDKTDLFNSMDSYYKDEPHTLPGSKRKAVCYFSGRAFALHDVGLNEAVSWIASEVKTLKTKPTHVAGLEMSGVPLVGAVVQEVAGIKKGIIVRKVPKYPSLDVFLDGVVEPGSHIIIVDDVVNNGSSMAHVIEKVTAAGFIVDAMYCLLHRENPAKPRKMHPEFLKYADKFHPAFTLSEFREKKGLPPLK